MNQTKGMQIIPTQTGEVFLQDKIVDETHCYICKKEFDKFKDTDMLLLRVGDHKLGFCCPKHRGIAREFVRQFRIIPGGWELYVEKDSGYDVVDYINTANPDEFSSKPHEKI